MPKSLHFEMFEKIVFLRKHILTNENKSGLESPRHIYIQPLQRQEQTLTDQWKHFWTKSLRQWDTKVALNKQQTKL